MHTAAQAKCHVKKTRAQSGAAGQKRTPSASARGGAVKLDTLVNLCERLYRGSGKWSVMMPRKLVLAKLPLPSKSSAALQTSVLTQLYPDPAGSICMQATPKKRIPLLHPLEGNTAAAAAAP